jgi:endonuclease-3
MLDSGIYLIVGYLPVSKEIRTKRSVFVLQKGWYYYSGSALNSLSKRIKRHKSHEKKKHWHIDYLLEHLEFIAVIPYIVNDNRFEHLLASLLSEYKDILPVPRFGSGDCKCYTHLFYSQNLSAKFVFKNLFKEQLRITALTLREMYKGVVTPVEGFREPFDILISCVISLRTKDEVTGPAAKRLFKVAPTPEKMSKLPVEQIEKLIYPAGFYKTKAKNIKKIAEIIHTKYNDSVPDNKESLMALPNVGIKTANLVLASGFGHNEICVDIHVHRISNRLGWIKTDNPESSEKVLKKLLPMEYIKEYNGLMVKHGQNICKPRKPNCKVCKLQSICMYFIKEGYKQK